MTDKDIVLQLQRLFEPTVSPGQAFDALFKLRQERVMWADVYKAVSTQGKALRVAHGLDESDDEAPSSAFECPGCGCSRTNESYCINPSCPEHKPNPQTERIQQEMLKNPRGFKNPVITFGKYKGKTLLEAVALNPSYVKWMSEEYQAEFWRVQAKLAMIAAEAQAPPNRDPSDTGYFG